MGKEYRPPVVVVLGHVDHGKTTLLDYIRKSHVADKEAGKITQSIGAYSASIPIDGYHTNTITFIDTPGHEAFTKLRSRGALVADIAILIVDATSSVQPQTIESISHIQQANIPFIVAINKVDLPDSNPDKIKGELAKHGVLTEGYGGNVPVAPISALKGTGVEDLLEALLIMAAENELTYDTSAPLEAYIIETKQDKSGIIASSIIKNGVIKIGDTVYSGDKAAKIRSLIDDSGKRLNEVLPSAAFVLSGFKDMPDIGPLTGAATGIQLESPIIRPAKSDDPFAGFFEVSTDKKLKIVLRADTTGSLEALIPGLQKNENIEVVLASVGDISESDIFLAKVSKAIVLGFGVQASKSIEYIAKTEKVVVKTYSIIYKLLEELQQVSELLKEKEERERTFKGEAKVAALFTIEGTFIVGVKVNKGRVDLHDRVEHYRDNILKDESLVVSIKQRAKTADSVKKGEEGGLVLDPQLDVKQGDVLKSYSI